MAGVESGKKAVGKQSQDQEELSSWPPHGDWCSSLRPLEGLMSHVSEPSPGTKVGWFHPGWPMDVNLLTHP